MRQRVVLAPRNAGEAVAVAVSAVLIAGSVVAVIQRDTPQPQPVPASVVATRDVRTVSTPGQMDRVEIGVDGSRLPRVPVFVEEAPKVLANPITRQVGPRTQQRSTNPSASAPLLEGLGPSQPVPTPSGVSIVQDFPVPLPPASTATPSETPSSSPTTTTPTTAPTSPASTTSASPAATTPPPAPSPSGTPASSPTTNASPAPEGTPATGSSSVLQTPPATAVPPPSASPTPAPPPGTAPTPQGGAPSGGGMGEPTPQSSSGN